VFVLYSVRQTRYRSSEMPPLFYQCTDRKTVLYLNTVVSFTSTVSLLHFDKIYKETKQDTKLFSVGLNEKQVPKIYSPHDEGILDRSVSLQTNNEIHILEHYSLSPINHSPVLKPRDTTPNATHIVHSIQITPTIFHPTFDLYGEIT